MSFAVHTGWEMLYVLWGSFTIGVGCAAGYWIVHKVLK